MIPIYKKGVPNLTDNYRGISLLNIMGKIYTSVIIRRLTIYTNIYDKIKEPQAGFREGYRTVDNAFILHALISKQLSKKGGKLYVAYIDILKAFDSINRDKLFKVLAVNGLYGKLYASLTGMYRQVKARVRDSNGNLTPCFMCPLGLKQGCPGSPIMFIFFH